MDQRTSSIDLLSENKKIADRRLVIDLALARSRPGTGSSDEFMKRRTAMQRFPDLRETLAGIDWVAVGAVAGRAYMPERSTEDLDIMVRVADAAAVESRLLAAGFEKAADLGIPGAAFLSPDGMEVDVLHGEQPWLNKALAQPSHDPAGFPVLPLPYLVLMKLNAGRTRDIGDVATMLGSADEHALDEVRKVVSRYSAADREDLESLIFLGRKERGVDESS
jgi:hypothetical protein